jgi:hypothetical protein
VLIKNIIKQIFKKQKGGERKNALQYLDASLDLKIGE